MNKLWNKLYFILFVILLLLVMGAASSSATFIGILMGVGCVFIVAQLIWILKDEGE